MQDVLDRLNEVSTLHLSCHGVHDRVRPLESALVLRDGKLTISGCKLLATRPPCARLFERLWVRDEQSTSTRGRHPYGSSNALGRLQERSGDDVVCHPARS
jgi:hypothetical protein